MKILIVLAIVAGLLAILNFGLGWYFKKAKVETPTDTLITERPMTAPDPKNWPCDYKTQKC